MQNEPTERISIRIGNWLEASASGRIAIFVLTAIVSVVVGHYIEWW